MKHTILCVDDEIDNVEALERLFRKKYTVLKATSAAEGLALIKKNHVTLIISDQRMPKKTGIEFLKESMEFCPEAARILLTGYTDIDSVIEAINTGEVYRYVTKPWDPIDLANTVDKAIERYELRAELQEKLAIEKALNEELKTLDEAKSNFMILINHELKTPLTAMISFLELLRETSLTAEQKKYLSRIDQGTDRLHRIVNDVLAFVSAETGVTKVTKKRISANDLVTNVAHKFENAAATKKQKFLLPTDDFSIKADANIVSQALDRLIDNAIKFGDEESEIEISIATAADDSVEIAVSNSGKPLSEKIIEKILQPFALDEDILKHSQGLGLGLSLTQALLKRHGSRLQLQSTRGHVRASFLVEQA